MLQAVAELVFEIACGVTGHALLWVVTLGRWKAFGGRDDLAAVVGLLFWIAIGVGATLALTA